MLPRQHCDAAAWSMWLACGPCGFRLEWVQMGRNPSVFKGKRAIEQNPANRFKPRYSPQWNQGIPGHQTCCDCIFGNTSVRMPHMPKISIDRDEWYPVYSHHEGERAWAGIREREVSTADLDCLNRAFSEFEWAQDLLEKAWSNADEVGA